MHLGSAQELAPCRVNKDICTHGPALNLVLCMYSNIWSLHRLNRMTIHMHHRWGWDSAPAEQHPQRLWTNPLRPH
jgi:hypothetical protein